MNNIKQIYWLVRIKLREWLRYPATRIAAPLGFRLLTKKQTHSYLAPYLTATYPERRCTLPAVADAADPAKLIFREAEVRTAPSFVWRYRSNPTTSLLQCGLLRTDRQVLNTDYWADDALTEVFRPVSRARHQTDVLIAPLGHYFEGNKFVGYYDFIFLIAAKLCRIKEAAVGSEFERAVIAYPLVGTSYEREFLEVMGFGADRVFDSRRTDVRADICYLGNHDNWMYQNPADLLLLKKHLEPRIRSSRTGHQRVYISRAGRRRIVNEPELIALLTRFDFQIIDDTPRSLTEQYAIYRNASFIVGPHGASFTNLLWCEPGTQLLELFTARFAQTHFQYLAHVLDLNYSAYCQDASPRLDYSAIADDITVSIPDLEEHLGALFVEKQCFTGR